MVEENAGMNDLVFRNVVQNTTIHIPQGVLRNFQAHGPDGTTCVAEPRAAMLSENGQSRVWWLQASCTSPLILPASQQPSWCGTHLCMHADLAMQAELCSCSIRTCGRQPMLTSSNQLTLKVLLRTTRLTLPPLIPALRPCGIP